MVKGYQLITKEGNAYVSAVGLDTFSFDGLVMVLNYEINNPHSWNVRTSEGEMLSAAVFSSLANHHKLGEEQVMEYFD